MGPSETSSETLSKMSLVSLSLFRRDRLLLDDAETEFDALLPLLLFA